LSKLQSSIPKKGWAARILSLQKEKTWWATKETCYVPKFKSTFWQLQVLADLGLNQKDERIANAVEFWFDLHLAKDGGYSYLVVPRSRRRVRGHLCMTGNMVRSLIRFGYLKDERVKSAINWLMNEQLPDGGWDCFGRPKGTIDAWEAMSAFAALPRQKWTKSVSRAVEMGAEFFLERELHKQGGRYNPWYRFHYPIHYYYDLLVGLDFMTALGYGDDRRLGYALQVLKKKQRRDGKWNLDAVHPDVEGGMAEWFKKHPKEKPIQFSLEEPGYPSKMITLSAMRILNRLKE
jgi:hypothetical protein